MRPMVGAGWRFVVALLIAVSTTLLFSAGHLTMALEGSAGDEHVAEGHHDVPVVSRQQESPEYSARRDDTGPVDLHLHEFELVEVHAFAAWPLPASSTSPRPREAGGWYARGPPAVG